MKNIIKAIEAHSFTANELIQILETNEYDQLLFQEAIKLREEYFGKEVYLRGLIEFTNYCKNDCYYCGIQLKNKEVERYRLTKEEILACCKTGHQLGFRTFVLQGGEDPYFTRDRICTIIKEIKEEFSDCALTLSVGEWEKEDYQSFFDAGADRYLLRHETASKAHYEKIHPKEMVFEKRMKCLKDLKEIGFQTGAGFMVGSPYQTIEDLVEDLLFLKEFEPEMIGIGPFLSHKQTPFKDEKNGSLSLTLRLIALVRILLPYALIPSTTALGTIDKKGREYGLLAGANVVMPNLSPVKVRDKYLLYDNKICTGEEAAECMGCLTRRVESVGYQIVVSKGESKYLDFIGRNVYYDTIIPIK